MGTDFLDEFLAFSPSAVNEVQNYSSSSDSSLFRRASNDSGSVGISLTSLDEDVKPIRREEAGGHLLTPGLTVPHCNTIYPKSFGKAALSESEILSLEVITLNSPHISGPRQSFLSTSPEYDYATFPRRRCGIPETRSGNLKDTGGNGDKSSRNSIRKASSFPKIMHSHKSSSDLWAAKLKSSSFSDFHSQPLSLPSSTSAESFGPPEISTTGGISGDIALDTSGGISIFDSEADSPIWWNHTAMVPMAQPSPTAFHANPHWETESVAMQLQGMISHSPFSLPYHPSNSVSNLGTQVLPSDQSDAPESSLPKYYDTQPQYFDLTKQHLNNSPSKQPRLVRKPRFGPSESTSPAPAPSPPLEPTVRKRKTQKQKPNNKQPPSTPRTLRTPSLSVSGPVDFVNYTPHDGEKLLTGVAPSGSSKTKARREKEALERRRKLSQAAVRAVRAAGGDISGLAEEGLII